MLRRRATATAPITIDMIAIVVRSFESSPVSGSSWVVAGGVYVVAPPPVFDEAATVVVVAGAIVVVVGAAGAVGVPLMAFDAAESPTAFTALIVIE